MEDKLVVFGAGGHARACLDTLQEYWSEIDFIGLDKDLGCSVGAFEVTKKEADVLQSLTSLDRVFLGIGHLGNYEVRRNLISKLKVLTCFSSPIVSKFANVSKSAILGDGVIVLPRAYVGPGVSIGSNSIINTGAIVEHDSMIGVNVHLSTGVIVNGGVTVGDDTFIGSGSIIRNNLNIGPGQFIRMGSIVTRDC